MNRILAGRTDLVFDWVAIGHPATATDGEGAPLIRWCAYYGDVSALRYLLAQGASLGDLGENLDLFGAAFHGHWQLAEYLIECGADVNRPLAETGEVPLHGVFCAPKGRAATLVAQVLLAKGADPNRATRLGMETGCFMRDCRTQGETPLHRAAAFGTEEAIDCLLEAGALREIRDGCGDSPLTWASRQGRPDAILRRLCHGPFAISEGRQSMADALLGRPFV